MVPLEATGSSLARGMGRINSLYIIRCVIFSQRLHDYSIHVLIVDSTCVQFSSGIYFIKLRIRVEVGVAHLTSAMIGQKQVKNI